MPASTDAQRRPVYIDRVNNRLLAEPVGAGAWPVVPVALSSLGSFSANTLIGRYGSSGELQSLSADVTIQLLNTATVQTLAATRIVAGSTTGAGVLQLTDSTSSASTTTAATPNAVKAAYDLANAANSLATAALPVAGGTITGTLEIGASGVLSFEGATADAYETILAAVDPTADRTVTLPDATTTLAGLSVVQTFAVAQRGTVAAQGSVSGTVTLDFAAANNFSMTLPAGGSVTLANPNNLVAGQSGVVVITQNAGTAATVAYGTAWKFSGGTPTMSTGLSSVSTLAYYVESASRISAQLLTNMA